MAFDDSSKRDLSNNIAAFENGINTAMNISSASEDLTEITENAGVGQIESQGARGGSKWHRLAPGTVKQRERLGFPGEGPILKRDGALEAFIAKAVQVKVSNNGQRLEVSFSSSSGDQQLLKIARIAQQGTEHTPDRPILKLTDADRQRITQSVGKAILQNLINSLPRK